MTETSPPAKKLTPLPTKDHRRREHLLRLTIQELEMMKIIWELGEASVAQVKAHYRSDHRLAYTTIMTVLSRLKKKGILKQRKSGKAFYYSTVPSREEIAEVAVDNLARIFFAGSRESLTQFCRGNRPTDSNHTASEKSNRVIDETLL